MCMLNACSLEEIQPDSVENISNSQVKDELVTRSSISDRDSVKMYRIISIIQADPNILLSKYTIYENGVFLLSLSRDNAIQLGISETKYSEYLKYIKDLNSNK